MNRSPYTLNLQRAAVALTTAVALVACGVEHEPAPELEGGTIHTDERGLVIDGTEDEEMILKTRSRHFPSLEAFADYAAQHLGATVAKNASGKAASVHFEAFISGKMLFEDTETGVVYEDDDFIRGFLGGSARHFTIGEQTIDESTTSDGIGTSAQALIPSSAEGCTPNGVDCIRGETWLKNRIVYSSRGSKTTQSRGGYSPVNYPCCRSDENLVTVSGVRRCRSYPNAIRELDEFTGKIIVINIGPPSYRTPDQCSYQARRNTLEMNVRYYDDEWIRGAIRRTAVNAPEAKWSELDIPARSYGIDTMCGYHTGSRGTPVQTSWGQLGANDEPCVAGFPIFITTN